MPPHRSARVGFTSSVCRACLFAGVVLTFAQRLPAQPPGISSAGRDKPTTPAAKAIKQWTKDLHSTDPSVREAAIKSLTFQGQEIHEVLPVLAQLIRTDTDTGNRAAAAAAFGMMRLDERDMKAVLPVLVKAVSTDPQGVVRFQAVTAIGRHGPLAAGAIPTLVVAARDKSSWELRKAAVYGLGTTGINLQTGPDERAVTAVLAALTDGAAEVRVEAVHAVISLGRPASPELYQQVVGAMLHLVDGRDKGLAVWARVAVMRLDQVTEAQLKAIAEALRSDADATRYQAARALGTLGAYAKITIPALALAIEHETEPSVYLTALWALVQMGEEARAALTRLTKHPNEEIRKAATEALNAISTSKSR